MRILVVVSLALFLGGCATSMEALGRTDVETVLHSPKPPADVAGCLGFKLLGDNPVTRLGDDHYVVARIVQGIPRVRWDILGEGSGSRLELRSTAVIGHGKDKAEECL